MVKWSRNGLVRSGSEYIDETYFQTHGPVMCFDGSDGSKIEASNVAGSDRPICVALGVADGRDPEQVYRTGAYRQLIGRLVCTIQETKV